MVAFCLALAGRRALLDPEKAFWKRPQLGACAVGPPHDPPIGLEADHDAMGGATKSFYAVAWLELGGLAQALDNFDHAFAVKNTGNTFTGPTQGPEAAAELAVSFGCRDAQVVSFHLHGAHRASQSSSYLVVGEFPEQRDVAGLPIPAFWFRIGDSQKVPPMEY